MTSDVTDDSMDVVMSDGRKILVKHASMVFKLWAGCNPYQIQIALNATETCTCWVLRLALAGFCFTLMAGGNL